MALSRWPVRRTVVVNLVTGSALQGVLWRKSGPLLVLREAAYLQAGQEPQAGMGEVIIERDKVEFIQAVN